MARHPSYLSDKLSRLAPPSASVKGHSPCGIMSLAEGRTLGAHVAGRLAYLLLGQVWVAGAVRQYRIAPTSRRGAGL